MYEQHILETYTIFIEVSHFLLTHPLEVGIEDFLTENP